MCESSSRGPGMMMFSHIGPQNSTICTASINFAHNIAGLLMKYVQCSTLGAFAHKSRASVKEFVELYWGVVL